MADFTFTSVTAPFYTRTSHLSILRMSDEKTMQLIQLYSQEQCLWNTHLEDYKSRVKRAAAAKRIAQKLAIKNFKEYHVITKLKNLRNSYCQELKKIRHSIDQGEIKVYQPRVFWFSKMDSFLRPHLQIPQKTIVLEDDTKRANKELDGKDNEDSLHDEIIIKEEQTSDSDADELTRSSPQEVYSSETDEHSNDGKGAEKRSAPVTGNTSKKQKIDVNLSQTNPNDTSMQAHSSFYYHQVKEEPVDGETEQWEICEDSLTKRYEPAKVQICEDPLTKRDELKDLSSRSQNSDKSPIRQSSSTPKNPHTELDLTKILTDLSSSLQALTSQTNDCYDNFGKYIASMLRAMPVHRALDLQPKIVNLITSAEIEERMSQTGEKVD